MAGLVLKLSNMSEVHNKKAAGILKKIIYITLATVSKNGQPWNSPLYYAFDKDLNFYWASDHKSVHSRNIKTNSKVFCVVYDSTMKESTGEGVYFTGKAYELTEKKAILSALKVMDERVGKTKERHAEKYFGKNPLRVYKVIPKVFWMNDDEKDENGKYVKDIKVECPVDELKQLI